MENTVYITLSRMTALRRQMDITANNIANMSTTGFKGERVLFEEVVDNPGTKNATSYVQDFGLVRDLTNGPLEPTMRPLDVALEGDGYFVIAGPEGEFYSRNGAFTLNADGELTHVSGFQVLGDNGQPIVLEDQTDRPVIDAAGVVTDGSGNEVGRLDVVAFDDQRDLRSVGNTLFTTEANPRAAEDFIVTQFALEGSNVKAIQEMTNMILLSNQFISAQKMVDKDDSLDRKMIQNVGRPI
ncbi:MAG: flagellar basal-body rod protein FlgF [Sneathiellaceae bacterium]|uniref:flagellar basal-body rod protein FlgF n=1 Tax=Marinovum algicola TaxID=42444 RepID=UPI0032ED48A5